MVDSAYHGAQDSLLSLLKLQKATIMQAPPYHENSKTVITVWQLAHLLAKARARALLKM